MLQTHFQFCPRTAVAPVIRASGSGGAPGLDDAVWTAVPAIGGFYSRPAVKTVRYPLEVKIARAGKNLAVRWRVKDPAAREFVSRAAGAKQYYTGWWFDFIELIFDPTHSHSEVVKVRIDPAGGVQLFNCFIVPGELYGDKLSQEKPFAAPRELRVTTRVSSTAWEAVAALPLGIFGAKAKFATPWGLQVLHYRPRHLAQVAIWQPEPGYGAATPQDYGDLYFEEQSPRPATVDLGRVVFDRNMLRLTLDRPAGAGVQVRARVILPVQKQVASDHTVAVRRGRRQAAVPFTPAMHGRWPVERAGYQRLQIEVLAGGKRTFAASYVLAYDVGVRVEDPYGQPGARRPKPSDRDFLRKYNQYICGRLPWFKRLTTRDGAKGDFILAAEDQSVRFDLMHPGVLDQIGQYIYRRYDNDMDRLVGASMFLHQRTVTCHSSSGSAVAQIDAAGMLRLCGALCSNRAQALRELLEHLPCETARRKHRTHMLGLAGHVVTLVDPLESQREDDHEFADHLVLDPDIGQLLIAADNRRVATLAELRANKALSYRGNFNNFRHGHEFYYGTKHQILDGPAVWGTSPGYLPY